MDKKELKETLEKFRNISVLLVGDVILDHYIWGDVNRISPEAPVPVVNVKKESFAPGGAANVANNLVNLGATVYLVSVFGNDPAGRKLLEMLQNINVITRKALIKNVKTVQKKRVLGDHQQLVRIDHEHPTPKFEEELKQATGELIKKCDVIILSDYNKGVITRGLVEFLQKSGKKIMVDPKPGTISLYKDVFVVKPNVKELAEITRMKCIKEDEINNAAKHLAEELNCHILVTRGREGISVLEKNSSLYTIPSRKVEVADVTGAGDTVISVFSLAITAGRSIRDAAWIANIAGSLKVAKVGTATVMQEELANALDITSSKIMPLETAKKLAETLRKRKKSIVFTNGCFDLLHYGHIRLLQNAKNFGNTLIVGLNSDISVSANKGIKRPIFPENQRAEMLTALECVDYVFIFEDKTPIELIKNIQPDVLIKGEDYEQEDLCGAGFVENKGGKIIIFPYVKNISTSNIIERIKNNESSSSQ